MAARPTWRGNLRLALVSCPIRLTPATTSREKIRFNKLNRETGNRLRQQMIDSETGEPVESDETVMGYEFEKGRYITVEKDEIDELKIESSDTLKIERVVPASEVDWLYWDTPYLLEPDGKSGLDIFATIRQAIDKKEFVGIGRLVMSRRERPMMIMPRGKGMVAVTLRDPDEVRRPETSFEGINDVDIDKEALSMAATLLDRMKGKIDTDLFEDRYQDALRELVEAKIKGQKPIVAYEPERGRANVVDLFGALKASLGEPGESPKKVTAARRPAKKSASTRTSKSSSKAKPKTRKRA